MKALQSVHPLILLSAATLLEVTGDALLRTALYDHLGLARLGMFFGAAALLFGYGLFLNLSPLDFGRVVGLYIAILFTVWQIINFVVFGSKPTLPILVGGTLVIAGGAIVTFWKPS